MVQSKKNKQIIYYSESNHSKLILSEPHQVSLYRPAQADVWPAIFRKATPHGKWQHGSYPPAPWPYIIREPIIRRDEFNVWKVIVKDQIINLKKVIDPDILRNIRAFKEGYQFSIEKFIWCVASEYGVKFLDLNPSLGLMLANSPLFLSRAKTYPHNAFRRQMILNV